MPFKIVFSYNDNQKTMEQKDDIISIFKCFDVVTKQIFLLAKHNLSEKGLFTL